jgi:hypothetical protein
VELELAGSSAGGSACGPSGISSLAFLATGTAGVDDGGGNNGTVPPATRAAARIDSLSKLRAEDAHVADGVGCVPSTACGGETKTGVVASTTASISIAFT